MEIVNFPLSSVILAPLVGAVLCALTALLPIQAAYRERIASLVAVAAGVLVIALLLALCTNTTGDPLAVISVRETRLWIPSFGVTYSLALDGISAAFTLLTAVVSLVVLLWSARPANAGWAWFSLLLLGEASVLGAFLASDLVLFYVFYELMLLPVIAAIALWGGPRRLNASLKFLLYTMFGSVLMFLAILYLGVEGREFLDDSGNTFAFEISTLAQLKIFSREDELLLGLAFLIAFALKIPMVPLHAWAPDTYREAPHGIAAFTAALLGKVGLYGIIRFVWPLFPGFMLEAGPYLAGLGALGVLYGALVAMAQKDMRSLLAYSSISHLGFCVLGLASASVVAWSGSIFLAVSHGLVTAGLFLVFGKVIDREGVREFDRLGGLAQQIPGVAFFLMLFTVASIALPLTSSFVGEFLVIIGSWGVFPEFTALAALGVVFGAVYMLTAYLRTMFGGAGSCVTGPALSGESDSLKVTRSGGDLRFSEAAVLSVLSALVVVLGLFPGQLLTMVSTAFPAEFVVDRGYLEGQDDDASGPELAEVMQQDTTDRHAKHRASSDTDFR
jgi:NADH-quinone oxidoreductase subunit M